MLFELEYKNKELTCKAVVKKAEAKVTPVCTADFFFQKKQY